MSIQSHIPEITPQGSTQPVLAAPKRKHPDPSQSPNTRSKHPDPSQSSNTRSKHPDPSQSSSRQKKSRLSKDSGILPTDCVKENELHCVICMDFPADGCVFQCINSHLLCETCHNRIMETNHCSCPTCRVKLSRDRPSRNRLAESLLAKLLVKCSNVNCDQQVQHAYLKIHEMTKCPYRFVDCKYHAIGCDWRGYERVRSKHEAVCSTVSMSPQEILKCVQLRKARTERATRDQDEARRRVNRLVGMMSRRARNIVIRDVTLEKLEGREQYQSSIFRALESRLWEFDLLPSKLYREIRERDALTQISPRSSSSNRIEVDTSTSSCSSSLIGVQDSSSSSLLKNEKQTFVCARLRCESFLPRRLRVAFCILPGPELGLRHDPVFGEFVFRSRSTKSSLVNLSFNKRQADEIFNCDSVNLRIIMLDMNSGLSGAFSTRTPPQTTGGSSDTEDILGPSSLSDTDSDSDYEMTGDNDGDVGSSDQEVDTELAAYFFSAEQDEV
eukprot:92002_1